MTLENVGVVTARELQPLLEESIFYCGRTATWLQILAADHSPIGEYMKLKASTDYGVRAVLYIAEKGGVCSSKEISEQMQIPRDYLIQLALHLRNAGIIKAFAGKNGGYALAKSPSKITLYSILNAFENDGRPSAKLSRSRNADDITASVISMHKTIVKRMDTYLKGITLADIMHSTEEGAESEILAEALRREADRLSQA